MVAPEAAVPDPDPVPEADDTIPWRSLVAEVEHRLASAGIDTSHSEARWLLEEASGYSFGELVVDERLRVTVGGMKRLNGMVERRLGGEPIQYVLGHWAFRSLDLFVDHRVLIPRPETEQVVEVALSALSGRSQPVVVDLGTGSGAIALAIASEHPTAQVWATDRSQAALDVATANLPGIGRAATRVRLVHGDWCAALPAELRGRVDLVVSNPPYVPDGAPLPESVVRWEPAEALRGGQRGLGPIGLILDSAPEWLAPAGALVVECSPEQAREVASMATDAGLERPEIHSDLADRQRVVLARRRAEGDTAVS
ncbi:MAG: peptide chain release factor N(5)-glutamine methyltransferase [Acidimicrobiia bacterium]|nr:peptide chain release factor N(5)-glutamine methyltransferase [Acidimicrobiia bacterium]